MFCFAAACLVCSHHDGANQLPDLYLFASTKINSPSSMSPSSPSWYWVRLRRHSTPNSVRNILTSSRSNDAPLFLLSFDMGGTWHKIICCNGPLSRGSDKRYVPPIWASLASHPPERAGLRDVASPTKLVRRYASKLTPLA